jgi:hypothetical protein
VGAPVPSGEKLVVRLAMKTWSDMMMMTSLSAIAVNTMSNGKVTKGKVTTGNW